jgi:SsrA-binding protein
MSIKVIAENRKARHDFELMEKFEAGLVLTGSEVKSIRGGEITLKDAFIIAQGEELFMQNCHISEYRSSSYNNHAPERLRKLLLNRSEIIKVLNRIQDRGFSCVPTMVYFKNGRIKMEIAIARGKKQHDKRDDIKKRERDKQAREALKAAGRYK